MGRSKEEILEGEVEKSKRRFRTTFDYVSRDLLERAGIGQYKTKQGDNFIRIISPNLREFWALEVFFHRNIGSNRATFVCPKYMQDKPCPVCEEVAKLVGKDPKDPKITALRPSRRYLAFVVDVESEETQRKGLQWFDMPLPVWGGVVSLVKDKRTGKMVDVEDPKDGRDVEFVRTGTTKENTRYGGFKLVDNNPIPEEWYEDVPDYEDILLYSSYDLMMEELCGTVTEDKSEKSEEKSEEKSGDDEAKRGKSTAVRGGKSRGESSKKEPEKEKEEPGKDNETAQRKVSSIRERIKEMKVRKEAEK